MALYNLNDALTGETPGGTWTQGDCNGNNANTPQVVPISPSGEIDLTGILPGDYTFSYTLPDPCGGCVTIVRTVEEAGIPFSGGATICRTCGQYALPPIIGTVTNSSDGAPFSGTATWSLYDMGTGSPVLEVTGTGNNILATGYTLDVSGADANYNSGEMVNPYMITVDNGSGCTADITFDVVLGANVCAGPDVSGTICDINTAIDLTQYLNMYPGTGSMLATLGWYNAPAGSDVTWNVTPGSLPPIVNPANWTPTGATVGDSIIIDHTITYTIPTTGIVCIDTMRITLTVEAGFNPGTVVDVTLCNA